MKYCKLMFNTLYFQKETENSAKISFCCMAEMSDEKDIIKFDDEFLTKHRNFLIETGELPSVCKICETQEQKTGTSPRTSSPENYKIIDINPSLTKLHYNCDNICNLKCIVCSSYFSSSWIEDEKKLKIPRKVHFRKMKPTKNNQLIFDLDFSKLKYVYFNGGEPLMSKDHIKLMNHLKSKVDVSKIELCYSTNGTFFVNDEVINLWKQFKSVSLQFSLDGTGLAFEYIRYPATWKEVTENINKFKMLNLPNLNLYIQCNIGLHNILYLNNIITWAKENDYNFNPPNLTFGGLEIFNFPFEHKNKLLEYVTNYNEFNGKQQIIESIKNINETITYDWVNYFEDIDSIRGTNWKNNLSKLYEFLK